MSKWILVGLLAVELTASAQMAMKPPASKFMQTMNEGMAKMDRGMAAAPMTGSADHDFAAMMIPHHQGAIDMAEAELRYGKDPAMRQLAEKIIAAQKSEIAFMRRWLKDHADEKQGK